MRYRIEIDSPRHGVRGEYFIEFRRTELGAESVHTEPDRARWIDGVRDWQGSPCDVFVIRSTTSVAGCLMSTVPLQMVITTRNETALSTSSIRMKSWSIATGVSKCL